MVYKSLLKWIVSFLIVDLLFWAFMLFVCTSDSMSCFESIIFGIAFFYLSWIWDSFLNNMPWLVIIGVLSHVVIGALLGWLLRRKQISWIVSIVVALAVVMIPVVISARWQSQKELTRETTTQLWLVSDASRNQIKFNVGQQNGDTYLFETGMGSVNLEAYDTSDTSVQLLRCDDAMNCVSEAVSFSDYLTAKTTCHQDPSTCPYEGLETYPTLFNVTYNPKAILTMDQMLY